VVQALLKPLVWLGVIIVVAMIAAWSVQFGAVGIIVGAIVIARGLRRGAAGSG